MDYCIEKESLSNFTLKKLIAQQKFDVKKLRTKSQDFRKLSNNGENSSWCTRSQARKTNIKT